MDYNILMIGLGCVVSGCLIAKALFGINVCEWVAS